MNKFTYFKFLKKLLKKNKFIKTISEKVNFLNVLTKDMINIFEFLKLYYNIFIFLHFFWFKVERQRDKTSVNKTSISEFFKNITSQIA